MSNGSFVKGLLACAAVVIAMAGGIFWLSHGRSRPEGVAEKWLTAVGDTTRKGVEADASKRAEKIGPLELADRRLLDDDTDGKTAFADIEVGKAVRSVADDATTVKVAFRVHTRRNHAKDLVEVNGAATLVKTSGDWHVTAVDLVRDLHTDGATVLTGIPALPSDGGPPPSSAPWSLWIGALGGSALIGVICTGLIKASGSGVAPAPATT